MSRDRALAILVLLLIGLASGCGGCSSPLPGTSKDAGPTPARAMALSSASPPDGGGLDELDPPFGVPSPNSATAVVFETVGEPDADNRYPSVVMIHSQLKGSEERLRECSGVILAPRLVLTAGHCVCRRRQVSASENALKYQVDGTSCAQTAIATVFFYEQDPHKPRQIVGSLSEQHPGRVRPHPRLEVQLDEREGVLSSQADLALIILDTPLPSGFRPAQMAKTAVELDETLTRVGFGYDEDLGALDGRRLVHRSKVLKTLAQADARFLLEETDGSIFRGDDGGPCFRETPGGPELVGISTTGLGQESSMTSLSPTESGCVERSRW